MSDWDDLSELLDGCCELFVGIDMDTGAPDVVWVLPDGRMLTLTRCHLPLPGRSVSGEVITTFGLTRFRRFSPAAAQDAWHYAVRLANQSEGEAPGHRSSKPTT